MYKCVIDRRARVLKSDVLKQIVLEPTKTLKIIRKHFEQRKSLYRTVRFLFKIEWMNFNSYEGNTNAHSY